MASFAEKISVFTYRDYRSFLKDWYRQSKERDRRFSFRVFSRKAGFRSPNFLKLVMEGKRNLSEKSLPPFVKALELSPREAEFFENLVYFTQSKRHVEKSHYYGMMLNLAPPGRVGRIEADRLEYCSAWYHPVVRELVVSPDFRPDFRDDYRWLASRLSPPLTEGQAKASVQLLERLGLIERTAEGRWRQTEASIATDDEVCSVTVMNYHLSLLDLAKDALARLPPEERDVSALTLGVRKESVEAFKKEIQDFRARMLDLASRETEPEEVLQVTLQCFPVSNGSKTGRGGGS